MPFFSSFTGSKTAGRRSDGVQNNPQGSAETRGDPVIPSERAVWLHLTANQAGVTHSDFAYNDNTTADYGAYSVDESKMTTQSRRITHTAQGVQTIVDNSVYNAARANTAGERIAIPSGKNLCPSLAVTNSVSNIDKAGIVARYGSASNDHYNPDNIERDGYNTNWIDLRGDAQTNANVAGTSVVSGKDGNIIMTRNGDNSPTSQTPWSMHTNPSEQGFVPAGSHELENSFGGGYNWDQTHAIGYRPFCLEAWIFTPGPFQQGLNPNDVRLFRLGNGTVWDLCICTYDNTAPSKTNGGWNPGDVNGNATTNPDHRRYALPRFLGGQLTYGTANTDVLQSARMDCREWNHIAWVRTGWGQFGDMVLYANGIEIYRASYDDYWNSTSGYALYGYMHSSSGTGGDFIIGSQSSYQNIAYLDDVRLTMGQPVYTKNFTPPNRKLPALRGEGVARSYQLLSDFSYPPDPKPDDLILHGFPVAEEYQSSATLSSQYNEIGNWANNTVQTPFLRVNTGNGTTTYSNVQPEVASSAESGRLDGGVFYFEGDINSDSDNGWTNVHRWKIGTELNDYITNQNGGSGIFDWTIEVGFRSANADHWMANNTTNEGQKFPFDNLISTESGVMRTTSANTLGSGYSYAEGMEVRHGSNHPSLEQWEKLESYVHKHILRIESPRTEYSVDSSGDAGGDNDQARQMIVLSASRENALNAYNSSTVTNTRHLTLRGYRKLSKNINDLPFRKTGQGIIEYVYDGYNVDDQGGMSTGDMSLRSNTVPVTEGPLKLNTWHHSAIVYKASTKRLSLFLDGSEVAHEILDNDFDWGSNGLQDTSDGPDIGDSQSTNHSYRKGPSISLCLAVDTLDVKFTARAKYDSRGYDLPANNHAGFGIDGPPYQSINPVDGSIMPTSSLQIENQLGFDGDVFSHWNVKQNFFNNDNTTGTPSIDGNGPTALNYDDTWYVYYSGNPGVLGGVPSQNITNAELKTFLTARYENVVNHANNDYWITPQNREFQISPTVLTNPLRDGIYNDFRILKANSAMAINKNDDLQMGGYGSLYFANTNMSNNHTEIKPWVFSNAYPEDHTGPLMIDMWFGVDHTDYADDGSSFDGNWFTYSNTTYDYVLGEIFRLGELTPSDTYLPATNQGGSMLRVGVAHIPNSNNAYWYMKWQGEEFYSHTAYKYMVYDQSTAYDGATDYWGNPLGLGSTVLPGKNGPAGNMFNHSIQIPFAFTDMDGNNYSDRTSSPNTDVANAYGYTSEPDWWYHPYAYANGNSITSSLHGIEQYDNTARSNTDNSAIGEYFTMLRQPQKASRKDTSVCDWDDPINGMHHIKAGMDAGGWLYLYVDGVLLIRVHIATYYTRKYMGIGNNNSARNERIGNHITEDGQYIWGRPNGNAKGPDETGTGYENNYLRIGPVISNQLTRPAFMYQDIRVSNNNIDSSQIHIPYIREGLPKPSANIVYGGAEPDANNVVFHMVPGDYVVNLDGSGNYVAQTATIFGSDTIKNYGWNANYNGDQSQQVNNVSYRNMVKLKNDTPAPSYAQGKYSHFSFDFDHSNSTAPLNGKNGEYLEIYHNHMHAHASTSTGYQDHTQSKWMWANTTHSNYNPFRIASVAEVTANPDLYMSSDFTIEMWLLRDFAEATETDGSETYNGPRDAIIGSSTSSGFTLCISSWAARMNVQTPASPGWKVTGHGVIELRNGTTNIHWGTQHTTGRYAYGDWLDENHPGGGIPEKEWFHLAIVRKGDLLGCFIDGQRHTATGGGPDDAHGFTYTGAIEFSNPWYIGGDESQYDNYSDPQYGYLKNNPWAGKIEDFRIINGECIYEQDFRPPQRLKRNTFISDDLTQMVTQS